MAGYHIDDCSADTGDRLSDVVTVLHESFSIWHLDQSDLLYRKERGAGWRHTLTAERI